MQEGNNDSYEKNLNLDRREGIDEEIYGSIMPPTNRDENDFEEAVVEAKYNDLFKVD